MMLVLTGCTLAAMQVLGAQVMRVGLDHALAWHRGKVLCIKFRSGV